MHARRSIITLFTLLACLGITAAALAEPNAYMRIKGKDGEIKGGVVQKGREDSILVVAVDHSIVSPVDAASGQATGKRQHKPFVITKLIDKSSPLLHQALSRNETLPEITLQFFAPSPKGTEINHYTIVLKNARISGIRHVMEDNRNTDSAKLAAYEQVSLVYEQITWTWNDGGITSTDSAGGAMR